MPRRITVAQLFQIMASLQYFDAEVWQISGSASEKWIFKKTLQTEVIQQHGLFGLRVFVVPDEPDIALIDDADWEQLRRIILEETGHDIDDVVSG